MNHLSLSESCFIKFQWFYVKSSLVSNNYCRNALTLKEIVYPLPLNYYSMTTINSDFLKNAGPVATTNNNHKNLHTSQFQKLKVINDRLENLIQQQAKELTEVTASNTHFISIIAHDLRSPFASIIGALEVLKKRLDKGDKGEIETLVNMAAESANKTLNLLDNLLNWTFSRNNGNSFVPVKVKLDSYGMIMEEIERCSDSAFRKQIRLSHSLAAGLTIHADPHMMATVIRNLIDNSIKYTKHGGEIIVRSSARDKFIEIAITDNGVGISHEAQKSLLSYRSAKTANGTGGLGLFLCAELVKFHGGCLSIKSEYGKGSEFTVTLPNDC